jgi:microcystin-dependent protein
MGTPYVGEIRLFAGNFPINGWAFCDGQQLAIAQNDVLFQLLGTTYGGDGQQTFNLPDLRGRVPIHQGSDGLGNSYLLGQSGGTETVTLTLNQIPAHGHAPQANSGAGTQASPAGNVWAASALNLFSASAPSANMDPGALSPAGGFQGVTQPHDNMVPFLGINFIISLFGVFPSQN